MPQEFGCIAATRSDYTHRCTAPRLPAVIRGSADRKSLPSANVRTNSGPNCMQGLALPTSVAQLWMVLTRSFTQRSTVFLWLAIFAAGLFWCLERNAHLGARIKLGSQFATVANNREEVLGVSNSTGHRKVVLNLPLATFVCKHSLQALVAMAFN